jgi:hypothetical protein
VTASRKFTREAVGVQADSAYSSENRPRGVSIPVLDAENFADTPAGQAFSAAAASNLSNSPDEMTPRVAYPWTHISMCVNFSSRPCRFHKKVGAWVPENLSWSSSADQSSGLPKCDVGG